MNSTIQAPQISMGLCNLCGNAASAMCQRCRELYCGTRCQTLDWHQHKLICFPMPSLIPLNVLREHTNTPTSHRNDYFKQMSTPNLQVPAKFSEKISTPPEFSTAKPMNSASLSVSVPGRPLKLGTIEAKADKKLTVKIPPKTIENNAPEVSKELFSNPAESNENYPGLQNITSKKINDYSKHVLNRGSTMSVENSEPVNTIFVVKNEMADLPQQKAPVLNPKPAENDEIAAAKLKLKNRKSNLGVSRSTEQTPSPSIKSEDKIPVHSKELATLDQPSIKSVYNWEMNFPINRTDYISVKVQYVSQNEASLCWVSLVEHEVACNNLLKEINKIVPTNGQRCSEDDIKINQIYAVPFEGILYRAVALELPNATNEIYVRLLDYGNDFYADLADIRKPIPLMLNLNAFAFQVKLPPNRKPRIGNCLRIKIVCESKGGIYVVEEDHDLEENLPTPPATPVDHPVYTVAHLQVVPIPENTKCKLFVFDTSELANGYISAGIYDKDRIRHIETEMTKKIQLYCKGLAAEPYAPKPGELCLAIFDLDRNWYRALCLIVENDKFTLVFVDYGNVTTTSSENIRHITKELLYPTLCNPCFISSIPDLMPPIQAKAFFDENPVFTITCAKKIDEDNYSIEVPFQID